MRLTIYSRGIKRIPNIAAFLPEYYLAKTNNPSAIAGWGNKNTVRKAKAKALKKNVPYISLEDGFLRSYDLGVNGAAPLSLVVDKTGIYYDANRTSDLEGFILGDIEPELIERARLAIEKIKFHQLSKYNSFTEEWQLPKDKYVLVIDQTYGDSSVKYGLADKLSFKKMLQAARNDNPNHKIIIKTHPDVLAGKKRGYLTNFASKEDIILTDNINPHLIFLNVEKVYTVTSLLGFEALFYGLPVYCFGAPFYAGWGLTNDIISIPRRNKKPRLEHVFAAAYIKYARYVDPYFGTESTLEQTIENLTFIKNFHNKTTHNYYCLGFSKWKRYFVKPYIKSANNKIKFFSSQKKAIKSAKNDKNSVILLWAAKEKESLAEEAGNIPIYRMEDGFIRSRGLGSNLIEASSLILDKVGIHFNYKAPSEIENILQMRRFDAEIIERAEKIINSIKNSSISKYNIGGRQNNFDFPSQKKKILVVGQVESDASIKLGALEIKTNLDLINKVKKENPDSFVIYKPHPDIVSGNRKGQINKGLSDLMITHCNIHELIKAVDEVHVITSLTGFEALVHDKKVVVYGMPFYHGWGLTQGAENIRRTSKVSVQELYAAAIISYPIYFDFEARLPCPPEVIVKKLSNNLVTNNKKMTYKRALKWLWSIQKK